MAAGCRRRRRRSRATRGRWPTRPAASGAFASTPFLRVRSPHARRARSASSSGWCSTAPRTPRSRTSSRQWMLAIRLRFCRARSRVALPARPFTSTRVTMRWAWHPQSSDEAILAVVADFVEQQVAELVEELHDGHTSFAGERRLGSAPRAGAGDEPAGVGLVRTHDRCTELERGGLVRGGNHAFEEVDVRDRAFEPARGFGDIAVILSRNERADAPGYFVRYVAIGEVEGHAGLRGMMAGGWFS